MFLYNLDFLHMFFFLSPSPPSSILAWPIPWEETEEQRGGELRSWDLDSKPVQSLLPPSLFKASLQDFQIHKLGKPTPFLDGGARGSHRRGCGHKEGWRTGATFSVYTTVILRSLSKFSKMKATRAPLPTSDPLFLKLNKGSYRRSLYMKDRLENVKWSINQNYKKLDF